MWNFPEFTFPLDDWINVAVKWLTVNWAPFFDGITTAIREPLVFTEKGLLWLPWWAVILLLAAVAWKLAGWKIALFSLLGLLFIGWAGHHDDPGHHRHRGRGIGAYRGAAGHTVRQER